MADTAAVATDFTYLLENALGGATLQAQGLVAASAQGTGVLVGKGWFQIVTTVTAIEVASNDEQYVVDIEANTADAATTWKRIGTVYYGGAQELTGRDTDDTTGVQVAGIYNPYDYQIRAHIGVVGTIATGINVGVKAYPLVK